MKTEPLEPDSTLKIVLDLPRLRTMLSDEAIEALMQAAISTNRLLSVMHLMTLNDQHVMSESETAYLRNKSALIALAVTQLNEAAEAVELMRNQGIPKRLRWANDEWERLCDLADRWSDRRGAFRNLRNWFGGHIKRDKIRDGLKVVPDQITFLRGTDAHPATAYHEGPDDLLFQGWARTRSGAKASADRSLSDEEAERINRETKRILEQLEADNLAVPKLLDHVVADLMGLDAPAEDLDKGPAGGAGKGSA